MGLIRTVGKLPLLVRLQEQTCTVEEDSVGSVHISISYDPAAGILSVRLIEVKIYQKADSL